MCSGHFSEICRISTKIVATSSVEFQKQSLKKTSVIQKWPQDVTQLRLCPMVMKRGHTGTPFLGPHKLVASVLGYIRAVIVGGPNVRVRSAVQ